MGREAGIECIAWIYLIIWLSTAVVVVRVAGGDCLLCDV